MTPFTADERKQLQETILHLDHASIAGAPLATLNTDLTAGAFNARDAGRWIERRAEVITALREIDRARDTLARYAEEPPF